MPLTDGTVPSESSNHHRGMCTNMDGQRVTHAKPGHFTRETPLSGFEARLTGLSERTTLTEYSTTEKDAECDSPDAPFTSPLPEREYTENHLSAFLERNGYQPWAEQLLSPLWPSGGKAEDVLIPFHWTSGSQLGGLNMVHDFDKFGFRCSGLAAGAQDKDFWNYVRVARRTGRR